MQVKMKLAVPTGHEEPNDDCPFCPDEEPEEFTTYPGIRNDSTILGEVMEDPNLLTSKQSGCRPREDNNPKRQRQSTSQPKPSPIHSCNIDGVLHIYSCEAHHTISGKQAMDGESVEQWISKARKHDFEIEKDTGYSINNADNGVWLPSLPEHLKGGGWGKIKDKEKRKDVAFRVMRATNRQWHKGPHNIRDKDGLFDDEDEIARYDKKVKDELEEINGLILDWSDECKKTKDRKENSDVLRANHRVHDMLDTLSEIISEIELQGPPATWRTFISRLALECAAEDRPTTVTSL